MLWLNEQAKLKKLAGAWQPLYQTLSADQKTPAGLPPVFYAS